MKCKMIDAFRRNDKLMMLVATASRMGLGMLNFILIARFLGPVKFGVIATAVAYSTFVALATDYGLSTSALRKASIDVASARQIVGDALALKALLSALVLPFALVLMAGAIPLALLPVYCCVFAGTVAYSMADLSMVVMRARRRFDVEAGLVVSTSLVMLIAVGGVAAWSHDLLLTAAAFLGTRLFYLVVTQWRLRDWLGPIVDMRRSFAQMRRTLRDGAYYAIDNILTVLSGQIDVLLFAWMLTSYQMGIYQAGGRLVQVIVPFAVVLSTVYMPALAAAGAARDDGVQFGKLSRRVTMEFGLLAVMGGLGFVIVGPFFTDYFYGAQYAELRPLWVGFGAYAMMRFAAAGFGIQLIALNQIRPRIVSQIAAIGAFSAAALAFTPIFHLGVTSWLLALIGLVNFQILGWNLFQSNRSNRLLLVSMIGIPTLAFLLMILTGRF